MEHLTEAARKTRILLLDVDGVLTDGRLYFTSEGQEIKSFSTLDGQGIKMLQASGIEVGIITGRRSPLVRRRAEDLGIRLLYEGREDKLNCLNDILSDKGLKAEEVAYVGDDLPDLAVIRRVGLGLSVPNAHPFVREHAIGITQAQGGHGAIREVCDLIMRAHGTLDDALAAYL